jgi:hypothetical protein
VKHWTRTVGVGTLLLAIQAVGLGWPSVVGAATSGAITVGTGAAGTKMGAPAGSPATVSADVGAAGTGGGSVVPSAPSGGGAATRGAASPRPDPTAEQLEAFGILSREAGVYTDSAKDYRKAMSQVVRAHYEERRRRVLSTLNESIRSQSVTLEQAREDAIKRLEAFVIRYSGTRAHPQATPDGMLRLAALYEERARANPDADLTTALKPAIVLYLDIIEKYPGYEESAAVHYYLGHALTDSGRMEEGQQAWRALVCANHYSVARKTPGQDVVNIASQTQDHDDQFWYKWGLDNSTPLDQMGPKQAKAKAAALAAGRDEELSYRNPYSGCQIQPQPRLEGAPPRYVAEIWWQLGNYHFDQLDPKGGPYNLNRAATAYQQATSFETPPIYGVSLYKLAWTHFKQQRYRAANDAFVKLLYYADAQQKLTGDPGADFRSEAYTYIASGLTYGDFDGPPSDSPYIARSDVLDLETDPLVAEQKMAVSIARVQDPKFVPQEEPWTPNIYEALAQEFIELTQNRNAIAMLELTVERFPLHRDAPVMKNRVAELYDELARLSPDGSAARQENAAKALAARTGLSAYVGTTRWTEANKDDTEAIEQAEELVRGGVKRAAADHTNQGRAYYEKALSLSDPAEQRQQVELAISEYRMAEDAWNSYLSLESSGVDAYDTRFWLADARYWVVVLQVALSHTPDPAEVRSAEEAVIASRDSNEDDRYQQPAAFYLVSLREKLLEDARRIHRETNGARGVAPREEVQFEGENEGRHVVREEVPGPIVAVVQARDEYNTRVPLEKDPQRNGLLYAFQGGEYYFVYGQFPEARRRLAPLYAQWCGKNEWGYRAWEKLISMSNFEGDVAQSRKLAEAPSCAVDAETRLAEERLRTPVKQGVAYLDARALFEEAEKMAPGPARDAKWRLAAASYKLALDAAPERDEAPEAAMNGAYAYKQVNEYDKAIAMYELFISRYGDAKTLTKLRDGDSKATPPVQPDKARYENRVKYLKDAYQALGGAYVQFFDYPKAAETFDTMSKTAFFEQPFRRDAAKQALSLYASLGDARGLTAARQRFAELGASPAELAEADYIVATADLKKWDRYSPARGANEAARERADQAMRTYYRRYATAEVGQQWVVRSAYYIALSSEAAKSGEVRLWRKRTIEAFDRWKQTAKSGATQPAGSAEAGMAAELDYASIDEDIAKGFDYDTGHHRYEGTTLEVIDKYKADATEAKRWYSELQRVADKYVSPQWATVAVARQGTLYDSLRTGLYNTRPPALKMFDAKTEALLKRAETSDNPDLQEKADAVRVKVRQTWRDKRDQELQSADHVMVDRYATAVAFARRYNVTSPIVTNGIRRLAFFGDLIGESQMKEFTSGVSGLEYKEGMFQRMRPGAIPAPETTGMPAARPEGI